MKSTVVVTAVVLLIAGCSRSAPPDGEQIRNTLAEQLGEIEAMTNEGYAANKTSALYLDFFARDPLVLPYGGETLRGRDEVSGFYTRVFAMGEVVSNRYTEPTIEVANGFAVRTYEGTAVLRISTDDDLLSFTNVYTDVLVQESGEWKIVWHSWVPAPADE